MRIFPRSRIINFLLAVLGVAVLGTIFGPAPGSGARHNARRNICQNSLKQIALTIRQYTQDYDEKFPLIASGETPGVYGENLKSYGWADSIQPYLRTTTLFQCPSEQLSPKMPLSSSDSQFTDYWFNGHLASLEESKVPDRGTTFLLGEGNDGTEQCDSRYSLKSISQAWRNKEDSPLSRHLGGANYAFADGHVKWLQPQRVVDGIATGTVFGFKPGKMPSRTQSKGKK